MPRPPRLQIADVIFNVGTRGVRRTRIYFDATHYQTFERKLTQLVTRLGWQLHTHCLMPNHYHLLLDTPLANLSYGMQRLNGDYAQWFNDEHGLEGHVFERRFYSRIVESTTHLLELSRYIVLNPVRAGLCKKPGDWRWSSYRALAGEEPPPAFLTTDWLLSVFGEDREHAQASYRDFVAQAPVRPRRR